ncbi:hypothetical protein [Paenarthrobacter sp. 4246]|uniref:hypothetical protein n=1 Tax=Paenarthrobacter sp. 4246 TaxID=3156456 RepID=UPI0033994931
MTAFEKNVEVAEVMPRPTSTLSVLASVDSIGELLRLMRLCAAVQLSMFLIM